VVLLGKCTTPLDGIDRDARRVADIVDRIDAGDCGTMTGAV
jgi:hypothetical protein